MCVRNSEGPVIQTMEANLQIWNPQKMRMEYILFCLLIFYQNSPREMNKGVHRKGKGGVIILPSAPGAKKPRLEESSVEFF